MVLCYFLRIQFIFLWRKSLSQAHFNLRNISKSFINQKCYRIAVVNNSISRVYLFIRMKNLNFHKVCNSQIAVSIVWGILFLFWYFISEGYSGEPRGKFFKFLRLKVIAIDWFLIYLIKQKETDATPEFFYDIIYHYYLFILFNYDIIYHYKKTSSFFVRKKSKIEGLQIKKTSSNVPDFL